jgi:hypothetical protein
MLSVALIGNDATCDVDPMVGVMNWLTGQLTVGLMESIVIVNGAHAVGDSALVTPSLTLHVTVIGLEGTLIVDPEAVEHAATAAPQVAVPVGGVYVTWTVVLPYAATRILPGHVAAFSVGAATACASANVIESERLTCFVAGAPVGA